MKGGFMVEVQKKQPSQHFAGENQQKPTQTKEEQIKDLLLQAQQKKKMAKELSHLLAQFHGEKSLLQLLPLIKLRFPRLIPAAIERIERKKDGLAIEDRVFFEEFKKTLF